MIDRRRAGRWALLAPVLVALTAPVQADVAEIHGKPVLAAAEETTEELTVKALTAAQMGDLPQAVTLATRLVALAPRKADGWLLRARFYQAQDEYAKAAADYGEVLKLDPKSIEIWQARGEAHFKDGKFSAAISDFDRVLSLAPERKPDHWQRGIALYYAGRFAEGKQQFEVHQTVNRNDVENAVWHFLCTARAEGLAAAKKKLIPIENDARVPMAQVHQLFAGKDTAADVLKAAEAAPPRTRYGEPVFYAHLYLGLYYEATRDTAKAREHILKAAERAKKNGYMGQVARVHAAVLEKRAP